MLILVAGLILFLSVHSVRIVADDWRSRQIARMGEGTWKAIYSALSIAGFALIVWGYPLTRENPVDLWQPPIWTRHLASCSHWSRSCCWQQHMCRAPASRQPSDTPWWWV